MAERRFNALLRWLPWLLWLGILVAGYVVYRQSRHDSALLLDSDVRAAVMRLSEALPEQSPGTMRIVHFLDPGCPCTAFTLKHLQSLEPLLRALPNEQWLATPEDSDAAIRLAASLQARSLPRRVALNVAPAVAIWSPDGRFAYFGPYSLAMICGEDDLLTRILSAASRSAWTEEPYPIETGCFCPWNPS